MGAVVLYLLPSVAVLVVGLLRARPRAVPEEYAAYRRRPGLEEEVVVAELIVRTAYPRLADLYEPPAPTRGAPR